MIDMLSCVIVVLILQHIRISKHQLVHLKHSDLNLSIIPQKSEKEKRGGGCEVSEPKYSQKLREELY